MAASLVSWRDGSAKRAIRDFIGTVTNPESAGFVPVRQRVAVFDNDGTLWCEQPGAVQGFFIMQRLRSLALRDPELGQDPTVQALVDGDLTGALEVSGVGRVLAKIAIAHAGITTDDFAVEAAAWLESAQHPRFGRPFRDLTYQPMLELLDLLRSHKFRVFVVTGGGVEFVRAVSDDLYGIPSDDVVGTSVEVEFQRIEGRIALVRQPRFHGSPNEGVPKTVNIQSHIGRRPILAAGNTAGDREMLEYAHTGTHPSLCLVIEHDDPDREYAYPGASVTDPTAEPVQVTAARLGWTSVSIKNDWLNVFPPPAGRRDAAV